MFRFYIAVARTAFRGQLIYRWANLSGLITNIFFGCIFSYTIIALYHSRPIVAGYDVRDTLRYTWLVQSLLMVVLPFGFFDLMQTIRSGEVVSDLSKPCNLYWYWFSREAGRSVYYLLFRAVPIYLAGMVLFQLGALGDWRSWFFFMPTLLLGMVLGIAYRYLYNLIAFWIIEARAMANFAQVIGLFLTGSYIPIPFLPPWLHTITDWSPFIGMINVPTESLLGKLTGSLLWLTLCRQIGWGIVLTCIALSITRRATRRVISQGG